MLAKYDEVGLNGEKAWTDGLPLTVMANVVYEAVGLAGQQRGVGDCGKWSSRRRERCGVHSGSFDNSKIR